MSSGSVINLASSFSWGIGTWLFDDLTLQKHFWSKSPPWGPKIWSNLIKYPPTSQWIKSNNIFMRYNLRFDFCWKLNLVFCGFKWKEYRARVRLLLPSFFQNFHHPWQAAAFQIPVRQTSGVRMTAVARATSLALSQQVSTAVLTAVIASGKMRQAIISTGWDSANMVRYVMITQITHAQVNVFLQIWFHFRMNRCHSLSEVKAKSAYEPSGPSGRPSISSFQ